jgi:hypothetical protein
MSLFPDEDILTKEIETWRGFIDKLPTDEDKSILTKLLNDCYRYSIAMNDHSQIHPFPSESLIMSLLLLQHKLINHLKSMIQSEQTDNWLIHLYSQKNLDEFEADDYNNYKFSGIL